jgi:hypothetical protein
LWSIKKSEIHHPSSIIPSSIIHQIHFREKVPAFGRPAYVREFPIRLKFQKDRKFERMLPFFLFLHF